MEQICTFSIGTQILTVLNESSKLEAVGQLLLNLAQVSQSALNTLHYNSRLEPRSLQRPSTIQAFINCKFSTSTMMLQLRSPTLQMAHRNWPCVWIRVTPSFSSASIRTVSSSHTSEMLRLRFGAMFRCNNLGSRVATISLVRNTVPHSSSLFNPLPTFCTNVAIQATGRTMAVNFSPKLAGRGALFQTVLAFC